MIVNAKTQRPSVCNACETVLIHRSLAHSYLPTLISTLQASQVEIRGCEITQQIVKDVTPATELDWDTEYLDLILSIKVVESLDEAMSHINSHGTKHSETIISDHVPSVRQFQSMIDACSVLVNCSSRFVDGGEFGFGAEVGISTNKLHPRGPIGVDQLTTYKYVLEGKGQIRK